jgi:hypothetical protein
VIKSESIAELTDVLKSAEEKVTSQKQQEAQQQQQMQQEQIAAQEKQLQMAQQFKAEESAKDRQARITEAEIRAAGMGAAVDINKNQQSDYLDAMANITKEQQYQDQMNLKREQHLVDKEQGEAKINIERQRLATQVEIANKQLEIAKENKNKYDLKSSSNKKEK